MQCQVRGVTLQMEIGPHAIHLQNDLGLWQLLDRDTEWVTNLLVQEIQAQFFLKNQRPLEISADSLAIEIWGHVYFEFFVNGIAQLVQSKLIENWLHPIKSFVALIDCGEKGYDQNRWFWDLLVPFKTQIAGWLPQDISQKFGSLGG